MIWHGLTTRRMRLRLVDLSQPNVPIADPVALDTSVVTEFFRVAYRTSPTQTAHAQAFFRDLVGRGQQAFLTPSGYNEYLHVAIIARYKTVSHQQGRAVLSRQLGAPIRHERDLLKYDPSILRDYASTLALLRQALSHRHQRHHYQSRPAGADRVWPNSPRGTAAAHWAVRPGHRRRLHPAGSPPTGNQRGGLHGSRYAAGTARLRHLYVAVSVPMCGPRLHMPSRQPGRFWNERLLPARWSKLLDAPEPMC